MVDLVVNIYLMQKYIDEITRLNWRWEAWILLDDLSYFQWMDCNDIVNLYLDNWAWQDIVKNLHKLHDLTLDTAKLLKQRWASDTIRDNLNSFIESDREEVKKLVTRSR